MMMLLSEKFSLAKICFKSPLIFDLFLKEIYALVITIVVRDFSIIFTRPFTRLSFDIDNPLTNLML